MRPVRLSLEGFTSFKEPVTLDFSALDLFVIHGATGAGKSSLLDALTYALFGKVPRSEGRGGIAEFISLGKKRATTALEFALRDERYRVTRTASRGKKGVETKALLERLRGGDFAETVAEGVSRVDGVLADKLHMPFDVFTQAVLLPQGQFATFLRSAPRERRQMLNELLQLQVFEWMHKQAGVRKGELETQLAGLVRRIEEDFAGVSRESFEETQVRIAETEAASERVQKALAARRTEYDELRRRFVLHQEWAANQETLRCLVAREPTMAAQEESLRRARAARSILPMLDEAERDRSDHESLQRETERLEAAFETARIRYREIQAEREAADDAAEEVPDLEKRRLRLAEIAGKVAHRMSLDENRIAAAESLKKQRSKSAELAKLLAKLDADEKARRRELAELVGERRPLPADVDDRLKQGHDLATRLGQDRQDLARRVEERRQLESQREAGVVAVDTTGQRRRDAEAKLQEAERSLAEALAERERRRHASLVDELRRELRAGDDCPVCGQAVEHLPACTTIATVADDVARLEKRTTKLRAEASKATAEALVAESDRDRLKGQMAEIDVLVDRSRTALAGLEADLGSVLPSSNGSDPLDLARSPLESRGEPGGCCGGKHPRDGRGMAPSRRRSPRGPTRFDRLGSGTIGSAAMRRS
jgi:exonuclease SbcC